MSNLLPITTTLMTALLSVEPLHLGAYAGVTPSLALLATYHWTIYRPDLLPNLALFAIGMVEDLLAGGLPGETSVTLLLCRGLVLRCRHYFAGRQFSAIWAGFISVTCGAAVFLWVLHSLLAGEFLDLKGAVSASVLTVLLFPVFSFLLSLSERALIRAE
jgi:rod shape-determining protein MreD